MRATIGISALGTLTALVALSGLAVPAAAQHAAHGGGQLPAGWHGRVDRANQNIADVQFMRMGESFHVVTGPHVILWNPERTATGQYRASVTYTQARTPERLEGYGLFVGGRNLNEPTQDYLYFLIRHDGRYMIRHRAGAEVHTLADWTEAPAVRRASATDRAENTLAIEAGAERVVFLINGTEVRAFDRVPMLNTDGVAGFRVGHHLDVQMRDVRIEPLGQ
ncbi:hypothetical protein BH23GEM9_BH23GEM9_21520 [soil metagenome]